MAHYDIDLTINTTAQERAAWDLVQPILAAHMKKVNRAYRRADTEQKRVIREHCPIFNQIRAMVEDEQ